MKNIETILAQIGNQSEITGAVSPPVYLSTAYRHQGLGQSTGYDYTRTGNPTRAILEDAIAELEGGRRGIAFSSGMAAIQAVLSLFSSGDELLVSEDLYGGTYRLFEDFAGKWGLSFQYHHFLDITDTVSRISERTKAIFIETPTNPLMHETDIEAVAQIARQHGLLLIVDNTFYTPLLQQPIDKGADVVVHSGTKYLGGHNDVLAGLIVTKSEETGEQLASYQNAAGAVLSPFDCWLLMRGMKTLGLRMRQHEANAKRIAQFLQKHSAVKDVLYPGQGGMLSFRLHSEDGVAPFLEQLQVIAFAESLGGVESFITYPATQTHADIPEAIRIEQGVCNRLLRMSVGVEYIDDLLADLDLALQKQKEVITRG
ncbi:methionine biosynthesis PLP-dependent protein [Tuberibacillus sp. Marseille-P3662]|uniref:methionine biosynthesis PLP-dependent protein n=1 Tax=Tuberibacillus sp. Marseille-P3662 TaxID=1965358 RepID=UPI000A1CA4A7|nr:methionine biosynthesis PLP-dependent protein [Tuberibacillus sp. Marseille-P3662]